MTAWLGHRNGCVCSYCQRLEKMARKGKRMRPIAEPECIVEIIRNDEDKDILQSGSRPQRLIRADSLSDLVGSSPTLPTLFPDFDRTPLKPYPAVREGKQVIPDDNLEMVGLYD